MASRRLVHALKQRAPDAIICTHFLPAELLADLIQQGALDCPVWVQVTDFDLHPMWVYPGMAGYFAGNAEIAYRMRAQGIAADRIHVTGIPLMPVFTRAADRRSCAAEIGLDPGIKTFLLMGGGAGLGSLELIAERLLQMPQYFQLIVVAGKNQVALKGLQKQAEQSGGRMVAIGFTTQMERLMSCADLAITKPGGLSSSECLALGLPMLITAPIPGQEERNADYLLEQGVAMKASDLTTLEFRVRHLLDHPTVLAEMAGRARAIGRPHAARQVMEQVVGNLLHPSNPAERTP
jgi:processive 1,2-diacylglycerol beta-glucosyltransferase